MSIFRTPHAATSFAVTRRNILAISGISASSFFEGCKLKDPDDQERVREFFAKPPCLVKGTRVATPTGDVKIEELEVGDCVSMLNSESRRIRWIGHRRFKFGRHEAASGLISPVRFSKGSLEADLPRQDLLMSRDHRLFMFGMLIRADEFINGHSISVGSSYDAGEIEYFHILTEGDHGIIFAEGVPSETLLFDEQTIQQFDNFSSFGWPFQESENRPSRPCAPIFNCNDLGKRARIRSHLRSALSPWIDLRNDCDRVRDLLTARS
jgi:Hint domain